MYGRDRAGDRQGHGGVNHRARGFRQLRTLSQLSIGDHVQVYSCGLGLELPDFPEITVTNCAPSLLRRWAPAPRGRLEVRVTHIVPAEIIGSGRGQNTVARVQIFWISSLFDPAVRRRFRLDTLRFPAISSASKAADSRFRSFRRATAI